GDGGREPCGTPPPPAVRGRGSRVLARAPRLPPGRRGNPPPPCRATAAPVRVLPRWAPPPPPKRSRGRATAPDCRLPRPAPGTAPAGRPAPASAAGSCPAE